jgi:hypothetical protein
LIGRAICHLIVVEVAEVLAKTKEPWVVEALPKVKFPDLSKVVLIFEPSDTDKAFPVPELDMVRTSPEAEA